MNRTSNLEIDQQKHFIQKKIYIVITHSIEQLANVVGSCVFMHLSGCFVKLQQL